MKHMNMVKKYGVMDLQLFAGDGGDGGSGEEDDDPSDDSEEDDDSEDDPDEKKFSQKDMDDAVKKRVAREKRKWQREQQKKSKEKPDGAGSAGKDGEEDQDDTKYKDMESRALKAETRAACFEAGVDKDAIDDVTALARSYMAADEDLDLEDAIEKVVKKYPHFKKGTTDSEEDEGGNKGKSWGERQSGRGAKKMSGVEKHFYELNPDLKK